MSAYLIDILIHLWLGFMVILASGVWCGIRHLHRRYRIARGERR